MNRFEIDDVLCSVRLPKFALFQSLIFDKSGPDPEPWNPFKSCDWVRLADNYAELEVPTPPIPSDPAKCFGILKRTGTGRLSNFEKIDPKDWAVEVWQLLRDTVRENAEFDTTLLEHCNWKRTQPTDLDLFGVRYTLLYLCPSNPASILEDLKARTERARPAVNGRRQAWDGLLCGMWAECIDRLWCYPASEEVFEIRSDVIELYEKWLNNLPDGPTKKDWDYLNESLMK
jgi:hypothetical protein